MNDLGLWIRDRLDRFGVLLSALCVVHCVLGLAVIGSMGVGGQFLLAPDFHRVGLALALVIAALAIGSGFARHRQLTPFLIASSGLAFMAGALVAEHGMPEAVLTIIGVVLVGIGHVLNLRRCGNRCVLAAD